MKDNFDQRDTALTAVGDSKLTPFAWQGWKKMNAPQLPAHWNPEQRIVRRNHQFKGKSFVTGSSVVFVEDGISCENPEKKTSDTAGKNTLANKLNSDRALRVDRSHKTQLRYRAHWTDKELYLVGNLSRNDWNEMSVRRLYTHPPDPAYDFTPFPLVSLRRKDN